MDDLLAHELLVVTGKGGVGKSTVAAALGIAACRRGLRTIVAEVAAREDVSRALTSDAAYEQSSASGAPHHVSIDPQRAMEEYLRRRLPVGALAGWVSQSRVFATLTAAAPGMRELLTVGKVWELTQGRTRGVEPYDLVVLDAPATGHGLAMLQAPRTFASVARVGPIARQGATIARFLSDPRRTAVIAVSSAEEMAVAETLELRSRLRAESGLDLSLVVVNGVMRHSFSGADERALGAAPRSRAQHAGLFAASWARHQRAHISRLRRGLPGVALVTLPFVFSAGLDRAALEQLSRKLER